MAKVIKSFTGTMSSGTVQPGAGESVVENVYTVPTGKVAKIVGHFGPRMTAGAGRGMAEGVEMTCSVNNGCVFSCFSKTTAAGVTFASTSTPINLFLEEGKHLQLQLDVYNASNENQTYTAGYSISVIEEDV